MERREKTEFILEQIRLLIALARLKDAEVAGKGNKEQKNAIGGGEPEWAKARVGGRKVNETFLKAKENEVCRSILSLISIWTTNKFHSSGSQAQILRFDDPTSITSNGVLGGREALRESVGHAVDKRRRE
jgi:hypothetical protein